MKPNGKIALTQRSDGEFVLPELPEWDGEIWTYDRCVTGLVTSGRVLPEALTTPITHLTPLSWGSDKEAAVYLVEPRDHAIIADAYWELGAKPPADLPTAAVAALEAAARQVLGPPDARTARTWPFFCLPGATANVAEALERDSAGRLLAKLGSSRHDPGDERSLEQVQGWPLSSVWRNQDVVLKLTNPAWHAEARITAALAKLCPTTVPAILSQGNILAEQGKATSYFLQRRVVDGEPGADDEPLHRAERTSAALGALAELQLACSGELESLIATGAVDRRPQQTATELERLWTFVAPSLTDEQRASLTDVDSKVRAGLDRLATGTTVIVHGDLHLGNVLEDETGAPQIIDWTDAAIAWPGVDLFALLARLDRDDDRRPGFIADYATALGLDDLDEMQLGLQLAPTYHALSYLRIRDFLPVGLDWIFGAEITRFVQHQMKVLDA